MEDGCALDGFDTAHRRLSSSSLLSSTMYSHRRPSAGPFHAARYWHNLVHDPARHPFRFHPQPKPVRPPRFRLDERSAETINREREEARWRAAQLALYMAGPAPGIHGARDGGESSGVPAAVGGRLGRITKVVIDNVAVRPLLFGRVAVRRFSGASARASALVCEPVRRGTVVVLDSLGAWSAFLPALILSAVLLAVLDPLALRVCQPGPKTETVVLYVLVPRFSIRSVA